MQTYGVDAAKANFSQRVETAAGGEVILITEEGKPVAKVVPIKAPMRRGMLAGVGFDAEASEASDALDAQVTKLFEDSDPAK